MSNSERCRLANREPKARSAITWAATSESGVVEGHVENIATGEPLAGLRMNLLGPVTPARTGETTADGEFRLEGLPPGTYEFQIGGQGFAARDSVRLMPGAGVRGHIRIEQRFANPYCVVTVE